MTNARSEADGKSEGGNPGKLQAFAADDEELLIPDFANTEQALNWGSHLSAKQHSSLLKTQRALSKNALAQDNLQRMVDLATQSQLLREAAEAFVSHQDNTTSMGAGASCTPNGANK